MRRELLTGSKVRFIGDLSKLLAGLPAVEIEELRPILESGLLVVSDSDAGGFVELHIVEGEVEHFFYVKECDIEVSLDVQELSGRP